MGSFFPELPPRYGLHPDANPDSREAYWPDENSDYDTKVRYWTNAAYDEAESEARQNEEASQMARYIDYLLGRQWPHARPSYRASPVNNKVWRLFWELIAMLTDLRPTYEIRSLNPTYKDQADMLNNATRAWWLYSDADMSLAQIIVYALLGIGYGKFEWDPDERNGEGELVLIPCGPNDVLPLKPGRTLQSAQAIIYRSVQPLSFFRRRFPGRGDRVRPDPQFSRFASPVTAPPGVSSSLFRMLSPQMRRVVGQRGPVPPSAFPMALYREFWLKDYSLNSSGRTVVMGTPGKPWCYSVRPGERLYPRGRLIIRAGEVILDDGPNPYLHGEFPFSDLRMNVVPWQFTGYSEMRSWVALQDILNNILAGVLDMIKRVTNPPFVGPKSAFTDSVWRALDPNMPAAKVAYNPQAGQAPQYAPAPGLPAFVLQVMGLISRDMEIQSGIGAAQQMMQKKQVPSRQTLEGIREAQTTPTRLKGRSVEIFVRHLGRQGIFNIFQFYPPERRMHMMGMSGLSIEDVEWNTKKDNMGCPPGTKLENHAKNFPFLVHPGSLLNINRQERIATMMALRKNGDISRRHLLSELDLGLNPDEVEKELDREEKKKIEAMMQLEKMKSQQMAGGVQ